MEWNYDTLILGSTIEDYFSEFGTTGSTSPGHYEYDTSSYDDDANHFETEEFEYRTENYEYNNKAYDSNNE